MTHPLGLLPPNSVYLLLKIKNLPFSGIEKTAFGSQIFVWCALKSGLRPSYWGESILLLIWEPKKTLLAYLHPESPLIAHAHRLILFFWGGGGCIHLKIRWKLRGRFTKGFHCVTQMRRYCVTFKVYENDGSSFRPPGPQLSHQGTTLAVTPYSGGWRPGSQILARK